MADLLLNDLLYVNEHLSCKNYRVEVDSGFRYLEISADTTIQALPAKLNNFIFLVEGSFKANCNQFLHRLVEAGQMILVPRAVTFRAQTLTDCKILLFCFGLIKNPCDISMLQSYYACYKQVVYRFDPLPIRYPLSAFLDLLIYCLKNGMNCGHFHEIKHKELFLYLRGFYTKEEVVQLFYPIMGKSPAFKDLVLQNYMQAERVEDLAQLFNMSRTSFYNKFVEEFRMSPKHWMQQQLKQQLYMKAAVPGISIKELIDEFNFSSAAQLNRFCMREFACTPGELIRKIQKKAINGTIK